MRAMAWKAARPPSLLAFGLRPPPCVPVAASLRLGHRSLCASAGDADGPELTFATSRPLGLKYARTRDGLVVLKKFGFESQAAGMGIDQGAVVAAVDGRRVGHDEFLAAVAVSYTHLTLPTKRIV